MHVSRVTPRRPFDKIATNMLRRFRGRLALGSLSLMLTAALVFVACDETVDVVRAADGGATEMDAASSPNVDASTDAPVDAPADAAACNEVMNAAPIVRATHISAPFLSGAGQGGELGSGRYFLTAVTYYGEGVDAGDASTADAAAVDAHAADADAGDAGVGELTAIYWQTTVDATVTLGTDLERAWHAGKAPDLSDTREHHESVLLEPVTATTVKLRSVCSDLPIAAVVEYTATATGFTLYLPEPGRVETYVKQ